MNWLDWALLGMLGFAAIRGFMRGFVVEVCGLLGIVLGIWAAVHFNAHVAEWLGLDPKKEVISFAITFFGVLVLVQLLAKAVTTAMNAVNLSLPNQVAGTVFGMVRQAFILSVLLNILTARQGAGWPPDPVTCEASTLYAPLRAFAPAIVPALGGTKWVTEVVQELRDRFQDRDPPERGDP